jgi:hypothetical protein
MPREVHVPEVIEPDESLPPDLLVLRRFAHLMDDAIRIPGTKRGVGLDAALGLIPGVGDVISGAMSAWIIAGALRHRVPLPKIMRMIWNVLVDVVFGAVPVAGDLFDVFFEENVKNMQILMTHRNRRLPPRRTSEIAAAVTLITIFIVGFTLLVVGSAVAVALWLIAQRHA